MSLRPLVRDVSVEVGARLRELRQAHGFSLSDVTERTGLPVSVMSKLERGERRVSVEELVPLARLYGEHLLPQLLGLRAMVPCPHCVGLGYVEEIASA